MAQGLHADAEYNAPQNELCDVLSNVAAEARPQLVEIMPARRRDGDPFDAGVINVEQIGDDDDAETEPDSPPVFLEVHLLPSYAVDSFSFS